MPFGNMGGPTAIVIILIVLLLFGAPKLPALARSIGQSMKILRKEVSSDSGDTTGAEKEPTDPAAEAGPDDAPKK
ncbi:twin-arginine translocase TatA/TatE family subunit [Leucobacter sp. M11]|uniref:twin-arginine translocase TatA/TatE family subunit n=1 Tax=Leucobacter sp. M11 TaxID=2993565 RepID=UPI002D7F3308|nr:twin-arginine translocase TatA/TatE family subunit [Leucobacter sp. M11]